MQMCSTTGNKVSRGVVATSNLVPPLSVASSYMMTLKPPDSPRLCSSKSHEQKNYGEASCTVSSDPQSSQAKLFARPFTCFQTKLTPYISIDTPTTNFYIVPSPIL